MKFDLSKIELSKNDIKRGLILPKNPSKKLAEFIGILTGDGHISFRTKKYQICITGNSISDYKYFYKYIHELIFKLFNINAKISKRKNKNAIVIRFSSKGFVSFMKHIDYYKHTTNIKIPEWIKNQKKYMSSFTKGLFDTDGSIFISDKKGSPKYPCVELTTISLKLAEEVKNFLQKNNFRVAGVRSYYYSHSNNASYKISMYGQSNLLRWIKKIGFSNKYKLNRTLKYKK